MLNPANRFLPPKELAHKLVSVARYLLLPKFGPVCPGADRRPGLPPLPFGITRCPPTANFFRTLRPLGDWEYLHYEDLEGRPCSVEMLYRRWEQAGKNEFRTIAPGLEARVTFHFADNGFDAGYRLTNLGSAVLANVNLMIGAPGFADRSVVDELWSGQQRFSADAYRRSFTSYDNVNEESDLLTEAVAGPKEALENGMRIGRLLHICRAEGDWTGAHCAHINKRRYLTSHVYANYKALAPGASLALVVTHRLVHA